MHSAGKSLGGGCWRDETFDWLGLDVGSPYACNVVALFYLELDISRSSGNDARSGLYLAWTTLRRPLRLKDWPDFLLESQKLFCIFLRRRTVSAVIWLDPSAADA